MAMTLYATNIYSNNGNTLLWSGALENSITVTVNSDNVRFYSSERFDGVWQYQGGGTFLGLATSANASSATYPSNGSSFTTASSTLNLYVVETGGGGDGANIEPNKNATPTAAGGTISPSTGYDAMAKVTLAGDPNLIASNVKKDVPIFDVTGTYEGNGSAATLNYGTSQPSSPSEGDLWVDTTGDPSGETTPAKLAIKYNGMTIFTDDEIDEETIKTLQCSGKVMSGNVEVDVTPGTGGGGAYQRYAGTFTYNGESKKVVTCPFQPDFVVLKNPSGYDYKEMSNHEHAYNNIVLNFAERFGKPTETVQNDPFWSYYTVTAAWWDYVGMSFIDIMAYRTAGIDGFGFAISKMKVFPEGGTQYTYTGDVDFVAIKFT